MCTFITNYSVNYLLLYHLQIARYILWSLQLAAFQVCNCAIIWKLLTLPRTSRPWHVLQILFVQSTRRKFWAQLLQKHCNRCLRETRGVNRQPALANRIASSSSYAECVGEPTRETKYELAERHIGAEIAPVKAVIDENNAEASVPELKPLTERALNSWEELAFGINRMINVIYLVGNALVFRLYLYPLLMRIIEHSANNVYVVDV